MSVLKRVSKSTGKVSYLVRVFRCYDPQGKRLEIVETFARHKEAVARHAVLKKQLKEGTWHQFGRVSLAEFFQEWVTKSASIKLKSQTLELYRRVFRLYIEPHIGGLPLIQISPMLIQGLYHTLSQGEKGLSPQTIRNVHTTLRSALKQALRWRYLSHNPCGDVDLPRIKQTEKIRSFTPAQAKQFLDFAKADRQGATLVFALLSGARPGEYAGLLWPDINFEAQTVRFERVLIRPEGGGWHFDVPKTRKSKRTIHLPAELMAILRQHRQDQAEYREGLGSDWKGTEEFVFTDTVGNPLNTKRLSRRSFKKVLKQAGLPGDFRLYDLRHTAATLLLVAGIPAKVVSGRLGHSSVTLTLDVYSHILPELEQSATEGLRGLLYPPDPK